MSKHAVLIFKANEQPRLIRFSSAAIAELARRQLMEMPHIDNAEVISHDTDISGEAETVSLINYLKQ